MSPRRILILDDDEGNRVLLDVAIRTRGFWGDCASTGRQALALANQKSYAIALLDVNLPDMSGLEVARQIRERDSNVVIIIATVEDDDTTLKRAQASDCDIYMVKPFDLDTLLNLLATLDPVEVRRRREFMVVDNAALRRRH
ncbi:MAG: response regulator [Anaerolineae bacterium]|nr:response regulator [Anaerolineae bacterium]